MEVLDQHRRSDSLSSRGKLAKCKKRNVDQSQRLSTQNEILVQNLVFLKQIVPSDPRIFMYCVLINMKLTGDEDETKVLAGLQKLRGSVVAGYTALYTVLGEVGRSRNVVNFTEINKIKLINRCD